jgi:DNA-binding SARP family transcriptional activator
MLEPSLGLPNGYRLERDPDVLILRRLDGSAVATFSTRGAEEDDVRRAAEKDSRQAATTEARSHGTAGAPHRLRARFLGCFEVLCDETTLPLCRNAKATAILKYLLTHRGRPVSRDHLMNWLWPESNLKKARSSLNSAIHDLRKLLSSCSSPALLNYILLEEGYYRISPTVHVATDVEEFDDSYDQGRRLEREGRMEEAATQYKRAVEFYKGDYLIEDIHQDWTMVERERLSNAYVDMLGRLAAHYLESGELRESVRACYRVLETDHCHENSHRVLVECFVRMGFYGRALRQYQLFRQLLRSNYAAEPSPQTRASFEEALGTTADGDTGNLSTTVRPERVDL